MQYSYIYRALKMDIHAAYYFSIKHTFAMNIV